MRISKDLVSLGSAMVFIKPEAAYLRGYPPKPELHAMIYFLFPENLEFKGIAKQLRQTSLALYFTLETASHLASWTRTHRVAGNRAPSVWQGQRCNIL